MESDLVEGGVYISHSDLKAMMERIKDPQFELKSRESGRLIASLVVKLSELELWSTGGGLIEPSPESAGYDNSPVDKPPRSALKRLQIWLYKAREWVYDLVMDVEMAKKAIEEVCSKVCKSAAEYVDVKKPNFAEHFKSDDDIVSLLRVACRALTGRRYRSLFEWLKQHYSNTTLLPTVDGFVEYSTSPVVEATVFHQHTGEGTFTFEESQTSSIVKKHVLEITQDYKFSANLQGSAYEFFTGSLGAAFDRQIVEKTKAAEEIGRSVEIRVELQSGSEFAATYKSTSGRYFKVASFLSEPIREKLEPRFLPALRWYISQVPELRDLLETTQISLIKWALAMYVALGIEGTSPSGGGVDPHNPTPQQLEAFWNFMSKGAMYPDSYDDVVKIENYVLLIRPATKLHA